MEWQKLLEQAAQILDLRIESYCEELNSKENPRYFHADCLSQKSAEHLWRLKMVNFSRSDAAGIADCLHYNNSVHVRLEESPTLCSLVRIPRYFPVPIKYLRQYGCSELIKITKPDTDNIPFLVQKLVELQVQRGSILRELDIPAHPALKSINRYNRDEYSQRALRDSGESLVEKQLLTPTELKLIADKFDNWYPTNLPSESLTLVHGDFAFGNLTILDGERLGLIDFEHTHIGCGLTDLAHLYVNLTAAGDEANAQTLLEGYQVKAQLHEIAFDNSIFNALVLERAAGKLNSMKQTASEEAVRLKELLLA